RDHERQQRHDGGAAERDRHHQGVAHGRAEPLRCQAELEDRERGQQDVGMAADAPRHLRRFRAGHAAGGQRRDQLGDLLARVVADLAALAGQLALVELPLRARRQERADGHREHARHRGDGAAGAGALPPKVASAWRNMSRWWRSRSSASRNEAAASARPSSSASRIMRGSVTSISCISPVAAVTRFSRVDATAPIARRCSRAWIGSAPAASKNSWATSALALVTAEVRGEVTMNCGRGTVTVRPTPFVETGTGWFVDGTGYLITNAHVVDPVHRMPPWVLHELKKKAIDQACVDPVLRA